MPFCSTALIDSTTNFVERPRLVAQRICRYADIVGRDRVIAGVDCGFGTFVGGVQFQVGRLMAFVQYQVTTSPSTHAVTDASGTVVAVGRLLDGPTHSFTGGLRFGLGGALDNGRSAGGY